MQEILAQQRNAAKPVTGRAFLMGVIGVIARLALAQIAVNLLIMATGVGLLNIVFYLYAIFVIVVFMGETVAGSLYMLKEETLYLQKTLGDSTLSVVEIPFVQVISVRPVVYGERLQSSYQRVTVMDAACSNPLRMRLAMGLSLFSATLARKAAGSRAEDVRGYIVAYMEEGKRCCCVFKPDEAFCQALCAAFADVYGADDRARKHTPVTMMAQAVQRAFPKQNAHVKPLVDEEALRRANEEIGRQKQEKADRKAKRRQRLGMLRRKNDKNEEAEATDEVQDDTL